MRKLVLSGDNVQCGSFAAFITNTRKLEVLFGERQLGLGEFNLAVKLSCTLKSITILAGVGTFGNGPVLADLAGAQLKLASLADGAEPIEDRESEGTGNEVSPILPGGAEGVHAELEKSPEARVEVGPGGAAFSLEDAVLCIQQAELETAQIGAPGGWRRDQGEAEAGRKHRQGRGAG